MTSEAQKRAKAKYDREKCVQVKMKLNRVGDADILARLGDVGNKQGYIKKLIREDMMRDGA